MQTVAPQIEDLATNALPALVTAIIGILPAVVPLIGQLAPMFDQLVNALLPILPPLTAAALQLLPELGQIIQFLAPIIVWLAQTFTNLVDLALTPTQTAFKNFASFLSGFGPVGQFFGGIISGLGDLLGGGLGGALNDVGKVVGNLGTLWGVIWDGIVSAATGAVSGVKSAVNTVIDNINNAIDSINGLLQGISNLTGGVINLNIPAIPHLAAGADVNGPTLALIGEGPNAERVIDVGKGNQNLDLQNRLMANMLEMTKGGARGTGGSDRPIIVYEAVSAYATALQVARIQNSRDV